MSFRVKIAVHRPTNVRVAVKIMDKGEIRAQEFTSQVRREIYVMRRLSHRHIVRMHEVLTSDTKLYIVMELVTGGELFDRIEKGRVPEELARKYFQQLVDGVDFCHKKGVAHRDLKPENLLLDENGDIKITDFGFSSMKGMDVRTELLYTQCGTPDYCAPEIIDSAQNGYNGSKVDAWSCGIILFALLTGRLPFQEQDTEKLYDLILACQVRYPLLISPSARDLLENLLIRDPSKRFDLQKVKRHPWFMVNYEGDDARLIKKRPFFNKQQRDLTGSGPPSAVAHHASDETTSTPLLSGEYAPRTPPAVMQSQERMLPTPSPAPSSEAPPRQTEMLEHRLQQQHPDAALPRNLYSTARPPSGAIRLREESQYQPGSPAAIADIAARAPTPPAHDVFTRVQDRPATPARRQTSSSTAAAFKAAAAAASMHANDSPMNGHVISSPSPGYPILTNRGIPVTAAPATPPVSAPNGSTSGLSSPNGFAVRDKVEANGNNDETLSEQDSVEDYEEKPALRLEMPSDPRQLLRMTKEGRRQIQSLPHPKTLRHRSDLAGTASNPVYPTSSNPLEHGSASLSAIQRPRRGYSRDGPQSSGMIDTRQARLARTPEVPSSPPIVYSPSSMNGAPSYDRFRSISPGYGSLRHGIPPDGGRNSPGGGYQPHATAAHNPWQISGGSGPQVSKEDLGSAMSLQTEILLRHHYGMLCKWRGSSERANPKLSQELRQDVALAINEMKQISRVEDKANMFSNFLLMFENMALSDVASSSPGFNRHGADDDYENTADGREDGLSGSGDMRPGHMRLVPTDISSEEEPLSWSPVVADVGATLSGDITRRRELSDLLNQWILRTTTPPGKPDEVVGDGDDSMQNMDVMELQRLVKDHHGGREESNLAEDLLRFMNNAEDGTNPLYGAIASTLRGQSPPPSLSQASRSTDSYSRYGSNGGIGGGPGRTSGIRSVSNNTPLPNEYVPGRFREPNSMPARGRNGNDRQTGLTGRGEGRRESHDVGNTVGDRKSHDNMASSMGMHNVAYYSSEKRSNVANRLRGALQVLKAKNHRLGESHAQFKSALPPPVIMRLLGLVLQDMGARVKIKKETKRKMKCQLEMEGWTLYAGIELIGNEDGTTCVCFRRSREDKGKTDTDSFHNFFEQVRGNFVKEANAQYPTSRMTTSGAASRRRRENEDVRHLNDSPVQSSAS